jgi:uridine kinase
MAESGVHSIAYAFPKVSFSLSFPISFSHPKVTLLTTAVDSHLNDQFFVIPGLGNFGDRYFGTEIASNTDDLCYKSEEDQPTSLSSNEENEI